KTGQHVTKIQRVTIWGNHSSTQYPDLHHALVDGKPALSLVDQQWYEETFIPVVQQRGAAIIKARGASSAASAASAAIDHIRNWVKGTPDGDWVSMAVPSDGSYGIPAGVIFGYPVTGKDGQYQVVQGLEINEFSRKRLDATYQELLEELDGVQGLLEPAGSRRLGCIGAQPRIYKSSGQQPSAESQSGSRLATRELMNGTREWGTRLPHSPFPIPPLPSHHAQLAARERTS